MGQHRVTSIAYVHDTRCSNLAHDPGHFAMRPRPARLSEGVLVSDRAIVPGQRDYHWLALSVLRRLVARVAGPGRMTVARP